MMLIVDCRAYRALRAKLPLFFPTLSCPSFESTSPLILPPDSHFLSLLTRLEHLDKLSKSLSKIPRLLRPQLINQRLGVLGRAV